MQKFKFYSGKLVPLFLTLLFLTMLSSCDQEEAIVGEEVTTPLFGKLQLKKDASGAYSIDLETVNITSEVYENEYEKTVNIDLYPSHQVNREKVTEDIFETNESEFSIYLNNKLDGKIEEIQKQKTIVKKKATSTKKQIASTKAKKAAGIKIK